MDAIRAFVGLLGVDLLFVGVFALVLVVTIVVCDWIYRAIHAWKDLRDLFEDRESDGPA
jgi:hypothetical protein